MSMKLNATACREFRPLDDQNFKLAVEEAHEVLDRRAGRASATQHEPRDALYPAYPRNQMVGCSNRRLWRGLAGQDLRPQEVNAIAAVSVTPTEATDWLRRAARDPVHCDDGVCSTTVSVVCLRAHGGAFACSTQRAVP